MSPERKISDPKISEPKISEPKISEPKTTSKRYQSRPSSPRPELGFRHWMEQVLEEAKRAEKGFHPDPVHDLRVALRRCRSMADGFRAIDPDPAWKAMKRAGGRVFRSLGDLRDVQVMRELAQQLASPDDALQRLLQQSLAIREEALKRDAQESLSHLDYDEWRSWAEHLSSRAARVRIESPVFQYVALERWHEAHDLHKQALRNRSQVAWHALRVGLKRFRYTAENFLPQRHQRWGKDLKCLQDALGEVHDLDVLWERIRAHAFEDREVVARWRIRIVEERARRIDAYREKMVGSESLWQLWRQELPQGPGQHRALLNRAQTLVSFSGASVTHARHVVRLALQVRDGLQKAGVFREDAPSARNALELAAMLQDVGRFRADRGHHKHSYRMLGRMAAPLDWPEDTWEMVAGLARYHRGALPETGHDEYGSIPVSQRKRFLELAAVLRLANALDASHSGTVRSIKIVRTPETIQLLATGLVEDPDAAPAIAIAKYLLETACGLPVVLRSVEAKSNLVVMPPSQHLRKRSPISKHRSALS